MNRQMPVWQWMVASCIAAMTMLVGLLSFASGVMDEKIEAKTESSRMMIEKVYHRVDRLEDKVDILLQRGNKK